MVKPKTKKKQQTPERIAHEKFLLKMGVTKKQLKSRKQARDQDAEEQKSFTPDTLHSVRKAYDD